MVSTTQTVTIQNYRFIVEMFRPHYLLIKLGGYGMGKLLIFAHKAYDSILYVVYGSGQASLNTTQY
jgi:hypothetical protein